VAKRRQHRSSGAARSGSPTPRQAAGSGNAKRAGAGASVREQKRAQFTGDSSTARSRRPLIVAIAAAVAVAAVAGALLLTRGGGGSEFAQASTVQGKVEIPLAQVSDGKAHFYTYESGGTTVNYFVLQSPDGTIRAAFDACDVCYPYKKGYHQAGNYMQCNNCGRKFRSDKINVLEGGCNPSPLERKVVDGRLVITTTDLEAGARYFL
jgi:Membrane iron-sulfur containing protein FtrD-like